jgi:amidohydrolase
MVTAAPKGPGRRRPGAARSPAGSIDNAKGLAAEAGAELPDAINLRRDLHAHPELGLVLPRTQERVLDALDGLGYQLTTGSRVSSVVAFLDGDLPGPTTLLRADMDALPMPEDTGLAYASQVDGAMHACGHDAHVAMLVGAARLLAQRRPQLAGRVVLMFQPGEEGFAGARYMLEEGLLEVAGPIDRAFAIHISPTITSGLVTTRPGPLMASADAFEVVVSGRGGHASAPHDALDPIPVACEIVGALQSMVTRRLPVSEPVVVTIARLLAGTTSNVIPEQALLQGTLRALSQTSRATAQEGIARVSQHVALAHECSADLRWTGEPYPVTINDAGAAERVLSVAAELFGAHQATVMTAALMGAEDWSYILRRVPGAMAFLGAAPPGVDHPAPSHSNRMMLDEQALTTGMALYAAMALAG